MWPSDKKVWRPLLYSKPWRPESVPQCDGRWSSEFQYVWSAWVPGSIFIFFLSQSEQTEVFLSNGSKHADFQNCLMRNAPIAFNAFLFHRLTKYIFCFSHTKILFWTSYTCAKRVRPFLVQLCCTMKVQKNFLDVLFRTLRNIWLLMCGEPCQM